MIVFGTRAYPAVSPCSSHAAMMSRCSGTFSIIVSRYSSGA
jgi:hypothetical protein